MDNVIDLTAAKSSPGFPIKRAGDTYHEYAETEWLVEGILETNSLSQLFADPESYKTFLAIGISCAIATGTPWLDHEVTQGGVLLVVGEGVRGLNKRFRAWSVENDIPLDDAPLFYSERSADLMTATSANDVVDAISGAVGDKSIQLIVIDTLARNMSGNESSPEDMAKFIGIVDRQIRQALNCSVMIIHHPGVHDKTRGRGTNALKGAVDTDIRVHHPDRDIYPRTVLMECMKMKDEERFDSIALDFKVVDWGLVDSRGKPITSGALVSSEYSPDHFGVKSLGLGKRAQMALRSLEAELARQGSDSVLLQAWKDACASDEIDKNIATEFRKV